MIRLVRQSNSKERTDQFPEGTKFLVAGDQEDSGDPGKLKVYVLDEGRAVCYSDPWVSFKSLKEIGFTTWH
jgi:hypothetical protein